MYPTLDSPGYGCFVKNVCEGMLSQDDVHMSCMAVIRGGSKGRIDKLLKYVVFYLAIIKGFFKEYDFIYIHFPNQAIPLLNFLYKFRTPKIVVNYHGEDLMYEEKGYTKILGEVTQRFCRKYASAIVVPSRYFKDIVVGRNILPASKVIVSPSGGINPALFFPLETKSYDFALHIGYVGRLEIDKGIREFLQTCDRLKQNGVVFKASVVGYGSCYDEVMRFIDVHDLKKEITIVNGVPQEKLGDYYRGMDLLIFSSSRTGESLGLTGIEAMACGVPVIGSDIGGIASYVENGSNGWLVPVKDIDGIVDRIYKYMGMDIDSKEELRYNCIETGKRYDKNLVCNQLAKDLKGKITPPPPSIPIILLNDNHLGALLHFRGEVIEALLRKGYKVVIVAPISDHDQITVPYGVDYQPVLMNRTSKGVKDGIEYFCQLYRIFKEVKPDMVINYTIKPILLGSLVARFLRVPSISFFAGISSVLSGMAGQSSVKSTACMMVLRKLLKVNERSVFLNEEDVGFVEKYNLYPLDKVLLLRGGEGVDTDKYTPLLQPENSLRFKVVMIARVLKTKGYQEFVEAVRLCKKNRLNIDFYLCGGIDEIHPAKITREEIAMAEEDFLFKYMGHLNNLQQFIGDADCVVLPSYYNEGMNRSLMEALSMGIPIITTDNRGCRELVIDGKTGFIIPPKDSYALYDAILRMYHLSSEERECFKIESRKYALERFSIENVINTYLRLVEEVLA